MRFAAGYTLPEDLKGKSKAYTKTHTFAPEKCNTN